MPSVIRVYGADLPTVDEDPLFIFNCISPCADCCACQSVCALCVNRFFFVVVGGGGNGCPNSILKTFHHLCPSINQSAAYYGVFKWKENTSHGIYCKNEFNQMAPCSFYHQVSC